MAKKKVDTEYLGERGEILFPTKIFKRFGGTRRHFEKPVMLGAKHETLDFYVPIKMDGRTKLRAHCFVQVKTSSKNYDSKKKVIKTSLKRNDVLKMHKVPAPTYLVAIDEHSEKGFLFSVNHERTRGITVFKAKYSLDREDVIKKWRKELLDHWKNNHDKKKLISKFI